MDPDENWNTDSGLNTPPNSSSDNKTAIAPHITVGEKSDRDCVTQGEV
jgi:hypothetical protein